MDWIKDGLSLLVNLKGEMTVKEKQKNKKEELINEVKNSEIYKNIINKFSRC